MIISICLLVALLGVLMYALASNSKLVEIGLMSFFAGLLAFLLRVTREMISIVR